jgi:hypothetical protein
MVDDESQDARKLMKAAKVYALLVSACKPRFELINNNEPEH